MKVIIALVSVASVSVVLAAPDVGYGYDAPADSGNDAASNAAAQYSFQWDVDDEPSGNFFGQQETRDGGRTEGSYYVRLPDTRLMKVEYYADETGYHPTITYEGEAQYPDPSAPAPDRPHPQPAPGAAQAPSQSYGQPAPAPVQASAQPPSQFYSSPGK